MRNPALSRSSFSRSQMTMLRAGTPACCSRSQMASTSGTLVEAPLPARQFTFSPTTSPGRAIRFQASRALSRS